MKNRIILCLALLATTFCGCAKRVLPTEATTYPVVGTTSTMNVGEELISHGFAALIPRLTISTDQKIDAVLVPKGAYFFDAENSDRIKFTQGELEIYLYKDKRNICVAKNQCSDVAYNVETVRGAPMANRFQQTLIYNGKIGNRIALGYREFSGNMARPAFSNEVSYDLAESTVLGYKGVRIEVIKATNTEITYKLLSGFLP